jgi:hypothetical protein
MRRQGRDEDESGADPWRATTNAPVDDLVTSDVVDQDVPPPRLWRRRP